MSEQAQQTTRPVGQGEGGDIRTNVGPTRPPGGVLEIPGAGGLLVRNVQPFAPDGTGREVTGYAIKWDSPDDSPGVAWDAVDGQFVEFLHTVYRAGMFDAWLRANADRVKYLWAHGLDKQSHGFLGITAMPIGVVDEMADDGKGLRYRATLSDTPEGNAVATLIADGAITENSTSIIFEEMEFNEIMGGIERVVTRGQLWDISPVLWGRVPGSEIFALNVGGPRVEVTPECSANDIACQILNTRRAAGDGTAGGQEGDADARNRFRRLALRGREDGIYTERDTV